MATPPPAACDVHRHWRRPHVASLSCTWLADPLTEEPDQAKPVEVVRPMRATGRGPTAGDFLLVLLAVFLTRYRRRD
jgi:hypothetical protein